MARPIWRGSISFGLVNVGVSAHAAVRDHDVHFHQLLRGTGERIRHRKVVEGSSKEVDADEIELGFEISKGRYVTFDPDEIAALRPASTRSIDITDFVALADIDPIYYERTYWLVPDDKGERAYQLLLAAMEMRERVGIGSVVMRTKQYLAAVRPLDGALAMSTMRFADEVVPKSKVDGLPSKRTKPPARELQMATLLLDGLASDWHPEQYRDTYTADVRKLIKAKDAGKQIVAAAEPEAPSANVVDLMEALQASLDRASHGKAPAKATTKGATKATSKATSTKRAAKRATTKHGAAKKSARPKQAATRARAS